jgi:excisionase family DNA binding protein
MEIFNNVNGLSRRELNEMINECVSDQIQPLLNRFDKDRKLTLLSRQQTADYLGVDLSTLYLWVKHGRIKMYGIGGKRYFKENEVLDSLIQLNPQPGYNQFVNANPLSR